MVQGRSGWKVKQCNGQNSTNGHYDCRDYCNYRLGERHMSTDTIRMVKDRVVCVVLTDGTVFEFKEGFIYIYESIKDRESRNDCMNVYEIESMYKFPMLDDE